ncbi:MAG: ABC transporter substrate-binding protein [Candidatus Tectomicrobia bacterium]|nr:ABC transporter substrate-binding protein [Candidatus Tectomicrobia bacterium]
MKPFVLLATLFLIELFFPLNLQATHGLAYNAELRYKEGFTHFEYASTDAKKGGTLTLSAIGSFDTLNPFGLKGRPPFLLGALAFESITDRSYDEPFSQYGLLAKSIQVAPDKMSVTYDLHPNARFSDGSPVLAEDVAFSFEILRSVEATPFYQAYYKDVESVKVLGERQVQVIFSTFNPELHMIVGEIPILPKKFYAGKEFGKDFVDKAMGSGPYTVKEYEFGKYIKYARNPNYWAGNLPLNVGKYNFDEIVVKYYKDDTVRLEAFKAGEFDFLPVNSAKQWARDLEGDKFDKRHIVKQLLKHFNNAGMQGFALNVRRPIFQDRRVRHALALALDFQWSNQNLFYDQYTQIGSFFANSELAATGLPSEDERQLLIPFKSILPEEVFTRPVEPIGRGVATIRDQLREASNLLRSAGWEIKDGVLIHKASGTPMKFTITLDSATWERIAEPYIANLKRLGVQANMETIDQSIYIKRVQAHDFDVTVQVFGQSQSPGNEQRNYWHSSSANVEGSRNHVGIQNNAVDALVEAIIAAPTRQALVTATQALDRVLWHEHYVVPHWYIDNHRVTYWNKLSFPEQLPKFYGPITLLLFGWIDPVKDQRLAVARKDNVPFDQGQ